MLIGQKQKLQANSPGFAITTDGDVILGVAPFAGTISGISFIPTAAITGANTNTRKHDIINKGQAGSGTVKPATLQYNSGVNAVAFDEKAYTLSVTAADLVVAAGDVLVFESTHVGTGIVDPPGRVIVTITRDPGTENAARPILQ